MNNAAMNRSGQSFCLDICFHFFWVARLFREALKRVFMSIIPTLLLYFGNRIKNIFARNILGSSIGLAIVCISLAIATGTMAESFISQCGCFLFKMKMLD